MQFIEVTVPESLRDHVQTMHINVDNILLLSQVSDKTVLYMSTNFQLPIPEHVDSILDKINAASPPKTDVPDAFKKIWQADIDTHDEEEEGFGL